MWPSNSSTSWKQMTISGKLPTATGPTRIFGEYEICHMREQDFMITADLCQQREEACTPYLLRLPHGQATPRIPAPGGNYPVPPTPYVNQTAVDQHKRAQPAPLPPRMSLGTIDIQTPKQVQSPQLLDSVQPQ